MVLLIFGCNNGIKIITQVKNLKYKIISIFFSQKTFNTVCPNKKLQVHQALFFMVKRTVVNLNFFMFFLDSILIMISYYLLISRL